MVFFNPTSISGCGHQDNSLIYQFPFGPALQEAHQVVQLPAHLLGQQLQWQRVLMAWMQTQLNQWGGSRSTPHPRRCCVAWCLLDVEWFWILMITGSWQLGLDLSLRKCLLTSEANIFKKVYQQTLEISFGWVPWKDLDKMVLCEKGLAPEGWHDPSGAWQGSRRSFDRVGTFFETTSTLQVLQQEAGQMTQYK